jgi:hypothetical protein
MKCPKCGSQNVRIIILAEPKDFNVSRFLTPESGVEPKEKLECEKCGHRFD